MPLKFTLVEERSANGIPHVTINFPDGDIDTLVLEREYLNEEDRIAAKETCNFLGHLAKDIDARVAMTGCIGSEDVYLTVLSSHSIPSTMWRWTKEGNAEALDDSFTSFEVCRIFFKQ